MPVKWLLLPLPLCCCEDGAHGCPGCVFSVRHDVKRQHQEWLMRVEGWRRRLISENKRGVESVCLHFTLQFVTEVWFYFTQLDFLWLKELIALKNVFLKLKTVMEFAVGDLPAWTVLCQGWCSGLVTGHLTQLDELVWKLFQKIILLSQPFIKSSLVLDLILQNMEL